MTRFNCTKWDNLHFWNSEKYKRLENLEGLPSKAKRFRMLELTPFDKVDVVILGSNGVFKQPEYAEDGLPFSSPAHLRMHTMTKQLLKLYSLDLGYPLPRCGDLSTWAKNGVLLLNVSLTLPFFEKGTKGYYRCTHSMYDTYTHEKLGWYTLLVEIFLKLSSEKGGLVFILLGPKANEYKGTIKNPETHLIIEGPDVLWRPPTEKDRITECSYFSDAASFLDRSVLMWRLM